MLSAAMNRGTNAATVCVLRGLVFSSLLLVLIKKRRLSLSLTRKQFFQMVPILCMAGMTSATLNVAYCFLPTGVASSIHFVYPVIVVAAEMLLFRTYVKKAAFPFLALSMVGIYLLQTNQTQTVALSGVLIALLSAVFWTSYIVLFEHSELRTVHPFVLNFYQGIILMAIGGIWLAVSDSPFLVPDAECLLLIIGAGIIAGIVAHLFYRGWCCCAGRNASSRNERYGTGLFSWAWSASFAATNVGESMGRLLSNFGIFSRADANRFFLPGKQQNS